MISGLTQPTCMAFLGPNDFLVNEKSSGRVKRVVNGVVVATVLDLPVNSNSERGLLGIALHPDSGECERRSVLDREQHRGRLGVVTEVGNPNLASIRARPSRWVTGSIASRGTRMQTLTHAQNIIRCCLPDDKNSPAAQFAGE